MDARVEPGWYYAGDGLLRFRDEHGWTSNVLLAEDIRGLEWPPPPPERTAGPVTDGEPAADATRRRGAEAPPAEAGWGIRRRLRRRAAGRHAGSHRASA